eukprot:5699808-Pyramimonas_sp.AAC.1
MASHRLQRCRLGQCIVRGGGHSEDGAGREGPFAGGLSCLPVRAQGGGRRARQSYPGGLEEPCAAARGSEYLRSGDAE